MSTINCAKKTVASIRTSSRSTRQTIVAVLVSLAAAVPSPAAGVPAAPRVTPIAAEARIKFPKAVACPSAGATVTITRCPTAGTSLSAEIATIGKSEESACVLSAAPSWPRITTVRGDHMDEKSVLSELEKLIQTGSKFGLFDDWEGRQLLNCVHHGVQDPFVVDRIQRRVKGALRRMATSGSPLLPPRLHRGDFVFGFDLSGRELRTEVQYCNAHTLIVAGTGAGKTNLAKYRALLIAPHVRGMWLIDLRKREFRTLRRMLARVGIDLKIIRCRKFRLNPLQVPLGVEPTEYASVAADFLVRVFNLPPRASTLLRSTIIKLYTQCGVLAGGDRYPTLFDLFHRVRADREANPQARQAVLDNLEAVLLALQPEMLAYHRGWDVHELARQHLVMELTGLPEAGKDLVLNYLLTAEFISRVTRGVSNPRMDLFVAFDEGQRLFSQKRESNSYGGNALVDLTGLVRGVAVGLDISVLTTRDLSSTIPSLTATKILGRCGSLAEYQAAGRFLGLNSEQTLWCAHHLVPGLFVGQIGEGNWRYPFVFRAPWVGRRFVSPEGKGDPTDDLETDDDVPNTAEIKLLPAERTW